MLHTFPSPRQSEKLDMVSRISVSANFVCNNSQCKFDWDIQKTISVISQSEEIQDMCDTYSYSPSKIVSPKGIEEVAKDFLKPNPELYDLPEFMLGFA